MGSVVYALAWLIFAVFHSILARLSVQKRLEFFTGKYYRLSYNTLALLKIAAVFYVGQTWLSDVRFNLLDSNVAIYSFIAIRAIGFLILALALTTYDLGRFAGITQVITGERVSDSSNEPLQKRFLSQWVRHPLYTGAFLILWGGATSPFGFWTALWGTAYLVIGTHFEERKLRDIYGDEYRKYQQEVPRYFPSFNSK